MVELVLRGLIELLIEFGAAFKREAIRDISHPKMRLLVIVGPVVHVGDVDKAWRIGSRGTERAFLAIECGNVAGHLVGPLAVFGRTEADDELIAAGIPESRHQIGVEVGGAKFDLEHDGGVRIGMSRGVGR